MDFDKLDEIVNKKEKTTHAFEYKGVPCEVVFWVTSHMKDYMEKHPGDGLYKNGGIWNSYFYIREDKFPELFKRLSMPVEGYPLSSGKVRYICLTTALPVEMDGGVTFYEYFFDQSGKKVGIQIGNDYNHIWNGGESLKRIIFDLKESLDKLFSFQEIMEKTEAHAPTK